jgi:hypothetical protein
MLAKLFGRSEEPALDPATVSRFRQLRERNDSEEPAQGKKDLLVRIRGMELQSASILRRQQANGTDEATATDGSESCDRDLTGRKGF